MNNDYQKMLKLIKEYNGQHNYKHQSDYFLKNWDQQDDPLSNIISIINKLALNKYIKKTDKKEYKHTIGCDGTVQKSEIAHLNNIYILTELGDKNINQ